MITDKCRQVYQHDDWGVIYYNFNRHASGDIDKADKSLEAGRKITVKWPDHSNATTHTIVGIPYCTTYDDMGQKYSCTGYTLVIRVKYRGVTVEIPLDDLKVRVE